MMVEIESLTVSDKDISDWLRDYAAPRVKMMRMVFALRQMAEGVASQDKVPEFVMSTKDYEAFRKVLKAIAKTESLLFVFEPETSEDVIKKTGKFGTLMGIMPLYVSKDEPGVRCRASVDKED